MSLRAFPAAAALFALLASPLATAEPFALAAAYDQTYRVDLATRTAMLVGENGTLFGQPVVIKGMAYSATGQPYAASDNLKSLLRLETSALSVVRVGGFGLEGQGDPGNYDSLDLGFTINCEGTHFLSSAYAQKLWRVDPNTGGASVIGPLGAKITGLAAKGRELYGMGSLGDDGLYKIDPVTGVATVIRRYPELVGRASYLLPAFDAGGQLWAVITYNPSVNWSDLARIDLSTGAMTILGPITGPEDLRNIGIRGFAINGPGVCPAGEPTTTEIPAGSPVGYSLMAGFLALLGWRRLRRRNAPDRAV
ncbi:hypothetical protein [Tahibacter amnicola]|uniref:Secreted protein with PEP-CTERM sorting signal n=1 Tax=Tahibacter amnicola TaxID=2976241 RepID=A0ABY6BJ10_9GAMM|nr:hypothetical protein [Tahibacter amnicola]UXI68606.1 hypothetical protein N4264_02850 [Tahibacter amnicola]